MSLAAGLSLFASLAAAQALSAADTDAAFNAAGFTRAGGEWRTDCYQPEGPAYEGGVMEQVRDLNGDGLPEAIILEGSLFCYGHTGAGFMLVSKQPSGKWAKLYASAGIPRLLTTRRGGWPEIEVGGPGFCFSIVAWEREGFKIVRHEYDGKPCRP